MSTLTGLLLILAGSVAIWLTTALIDAYYDAAEERDREQRAAEHAADVAAAHTANTTARWRD